jgi:undecaprenyl-diphosphatase
MKKSSWAKLPFAKVFQKIWHFFGGRILLGLLGAISALIFFLWLSDEVFEGSTKVFDDNIRNAIHEIATPWLTQVMIVFSFIGSFEFLICLAIIIIIVFARLKWKRAIALFLVTMAGELILSLTLKEFFRRVRPAAFFDYPLPDSYSFPSGHALGAFCFFGVLAWLITARLQKREYQILVWTLAVLLIFFIGFSRIYLGVHFPSDVIAGYTSAFVWIFTVAFSDFWLKRRTV